MRGPVNDPTDAAVGMMDGAYFTSRTEILEFFNDLLGMSLTKIEQTAMGGVACQVMDYLFPGTVPMKRVNWAARTDFQYVENYKVLQTAFQKNRVQKPIDVDRLVRAKYQDNLEFCQWLKAYFDHCNPPDRGNDYDPLARRAMGKGGNNLATHFLPKNSNGRGGSSRAAPSSSRRPAAPPQPPRPRRKVGTSTNNTRGVTSTEKTSSFPERAPLGIPKRQSSDKIVADANLMKKNSELNERVAELELTLNGIEKERDFYFEKLRGIEVMLQVHEETDVNQQPNGKTTDTLLKDIFRVLYATTEDNVVVTDEGEILECNGNESLLESVANEPVGGKENSHHFDDEMSDLLGD